VYSTILEEDYSKTTLPICESRKKHSVGPLVWGRNKTAACLYASSEPDDDSDLIGFHKAFDVEEEKLAYEFDESGAGDAMAITDDGK